MVIIALDTEEPKRKHGVAKHARDGMFKHRIHMINKQLTHWQVWTRITAEIQMVKQLYGALLLS